MVDKNLDLKEQLEAAITGSTLNACLVANTLNVMIHRIVPSWTAIPTSRHVNKLILTIYKTLYSLLRIQN